MKNKKEKQIKVIGGIILIVLLVLSLIGKMGKTNSSLASELDINGEFVDSMVLKNPLVAKIEEDLAKKEEAKNERKLKEKREKLLEEKEKKVVYLTFDDGPSKISTPRILDILKEEEVPATFFVLGQMVDTNPDVLKRIHDEGHAIGHHSYGHNYSYLYSDFNNFMADIEKTARSMKNILGEDFETGLLRLPGGAFGEKKREYVNLAAKEGYINYNWNALNGDSEGHNMSTDYLLNRLKATVGEQKKVIVLMHDTDAKATTVQSLPASIKYLKEQGYEFRKLEVGD